MGFLKHERRLWDLWPHRLMPDGTVAMFFSNLREVQAIVSFAKHACQRHHVVDTAELNLAPKQSRS